jgi:hypothetical protein
VLSPGRKVSLYREKTQSSLSSTPQTAVGATLGTTTTAPAAGK